MDSLIRGLVAGAAGTTALNVVTYLDMAARARPASSTPEQSVDKLADIAGVELGAEEDKAANRKSGLGSLLGFGTGVGAATAYGLLARRRRLPWPATALAMTGLALLGSNAPMTMLGLTDPRRWPADQWAADVLPHVAYGAVAASVYHALK